MAAKRKRSPRKKHRLSTWASALTQTNSFGLSHELWAIIFFLLAFFIFICNSYPNTTGLLGNWIHYFSVRLFGIKGTEYLPLFLTVCSFSLLCTNIQKKIILASASVSYIFFVILLESTHHYDSPAPFFRLDSQVGGIVGVVGQFILHKFVGTNGALLFTIGVFTISMILLFGLSIRSVLIQLIQLISTQLSKKKPSSSKVSAVKKLPLFYWKQYLILSLFYRKRTRHARHSPHSIRTPFDDLQPEGLPPPSFDLPADYPSFNTAPPLPQSTTLPLSSPVASPISSPSETAESSPFRPPENTVLFKLPPLSLLKSGKKLDLDSDSLKRHNQNHAKILENTLQSFNVKAHVVNITTGPSVTRFELQPGEGVKISKITALYKDIALKLAAPDIRIEAPIPGKALVGIEVPNQTVNMISFRSLIDQTDFYNPKARLLTLIGLSITGESIAMDLAKLPHILIAGATGSGKSVCINVIILSILMRSTPDDVKFLMIDPKKVELSLYEGIPHLLAPVVTNPHKAAATLKKWALIEMERRYEDFSKVGVKDIAGYNTHMNKEIKTYEKRAQIIRQKESISEEERAFLEQPVKKIPYIVVIIDELADLMMVASQDVEQTICRLAQMARATGIHLVIATQRPSVNVITGLIKANIPSRISFFLQSQIDSRTILDMAGAEKLLGKGDMLYSPVGSFKPNRVQGVFISEHEVKSVVKWLKSQGSPEYDDEILDVTPLNETTGKAQSSADDKDTLYEDAKSLVMSTQYASTSYLQRKLRIGYNRAARIMDQLTENGIIAEYAGEKKPRSIPV
jgi:S-DNA-T family DNA segregation ATPase FtsK/SpoIIIE